MKTLSFLIIALAASTCLQAQQQFSKEQQQIQQTITKVFEALSNKDAAALKTNCTADVTFYEYGQIWSIDTLISKAIATNQSADFKRTNTFDFINTETDKTTAWATYHLTSIITKDGKQTTVQWLETVVLAKQEKRWKLKHLHSTLIKRS